MKNQPELQNQSYDLFTQGGTYINQLRLYYGYFNSIPNIKTVSEIDFKALKKWIESEFKNDIKIINYSQNCTKKATEFNDLNFVFEDKILINIYLDDFFILFDSKHEIFAESIITKVKPFIKKKKRTKEISLVVASSQGLYTKEIEIKKPKLAIDLHYNDDFKEVHQTVLKTLKLKNHKGLFLFHGLPGTGKSTYIKFLIHQQNKKVIFISPKMAGSLDSIEFTEFLIDNQNSILIIEDAEELIVSRKNNRNSHLSFLLNLTDGILADSLNIQIIATFNTDLQNIDKALLRKGRLTAIYEFKALEYKKANKLFEHLKIEKEVFEPMVITEIFNFEETNFGAEKERIKIGF